MNKNYKIILNLVLTIIYAKGGTHFKKNMNAACDNSHLDQLLLDFEYSQSSHISKQGC